MHVSLLLQFVVGSTQKWRRMTGLNRTNFCSALFVTETMWGLIVSAEIHWRNRFLCSL